MFSFTHALCLFRAFLSENKKYGKKTVLSFPWVSCFEYQKFFFQFASNLFCINPTDLIIHPSYDELKILQRNLVCRKDCLLFPINCIQKWRIFTSTCNFRFSAYFVDQILSHLKLTQYSVDTQRQYGAMHQNLFPFAAD